jgi:hypothetical protein
MTISTRVIGTAGAALTFGLLLLVVSQRDSHAQYTTPVRVMNANSQPVPSRDPAVTWTIRRSSHFRFNYRHSLPRSTAAAARRCTSRFRQVSGWSSSI